MLWGNGYWGLYYLASLRLFCCVPCTGILSLFDCTSYKVNILSTLSQPRPPPLCDLLLCIPYSVSPIGNTWGQRARVPTAHRGKRAAGWLCGDVLACHSVLWASAVVCSQTEVKEVIGESFTCQPNLPCYVLSADHVLMQLSSTCEKSLAL